LLDADVNASLRQYQKEGRTFDAIVLDPPKFAPTVTHAERAARAYKDINRLALSSWSRAACCSPTRARAASAPTCSTRSWPRPALDAGVDGFISERMGGAPDHPMTVAFPEGEYLKGLVLVKRVGG
jgi:23S rRNA (cytosine1962-C5)-methyltransferase